MENTDLRKRNKQTKLKWIQSFKSLVDVRKKENRYDEREKQF